MGADGGSIPYRTDLVKTKAKATQTDKATLRELFFLCALSKRPLSRPVVLDPLGKLYNKDAVLEFFIDKSKYGDGDQICGYLKGVKELLTLNLTSNPEYTPGPSSTSMLPIRAPFVCPLSLREMSGSVPFIALRPCGCVFSDAAVRAVIPSLTKGPGTQAAKDEKPDESKAFVKSNGDEDKDNVACPNCGKDIKPKEKDSIIPINPSKDVQEKLLEDLLIHRAAAKAGKKRKAISITTGTDPLIQPDKAIDPKVTKIENPAKIPRTSSNSPAPRLQGDENGSGRSTPVPGINLRQTVHQKLAESELKRQREKEGMSDAVKSMFAPKDNGGKKDAAAEFFGRTFTRYA